MIYINHQYIDDIAGLLEKYLDKRSLDGTGCKVEYEKQQGGKEKTYFYRVPVGDFSFCLGCFDLACRSSASIIRAFMQFLIITPIALLMGVRIVPNPLYIILAIIVMAITAIGFSAFSVWIATFMKTRERFMGLGRARTMPLFFASNSIYPISIMPPIFREIALGNPLMYSVDALRKALIIGATNGLITDITALVIFMSIFTVLASIQIRRIIE
jgi:ABC-2 type transport system permease protein